MLHNCTDKKMRKTEKVGFLYECKHCGGGYMMASNPELEDEK